MPEAFGPSQGDAGIEQGVLSSAQGDRESRQAGVAKQEAKRLAAERQIREADDVNPDWISKGIQGDPEQAAAQLRKEAATIAHRPKTAEERETQARVRMERRMRGST